MKTCNMDCLHCKYVDCINDSATTKEEHILSEQLDHDVNKCCERDTKINTYTGKQLDNYLYNQSHDGKARTAEYNSSDKAKQCQERYNHSDKGKERTYRYNHSENGILSRKEYEEKRRGVRKRNKEPIPYSERKEYYHERYLKQKAAGKSC